MSAGSANARELQLIAEGEALHRLARHLLSTPDADDAVQQTLLTALDEPAAGRGYLRGWLRVTLRRVAVGAWRSERRRAARERVVARAEAQPEADPAAIAVQAELIAAVGAAVQALHEPLRSAVILRFWHGLSPDAIAERVGASRNTVRSRLQRGLELLRGRLDARYGDRARWTAPLGVLVGVRGAPMMPVGGGVLFFLGMLMKTKLSLAVAVVLLAAVAIPWSLVDPPASLETTASSPTPPLPDSAPAPAEIPTPRRQEVPATAPGEPAPFDPSPVRVEPWLARFRVVDEGGAAVADAEITIRAARKVPTNRREGPITRAYTYRGVTDQVCGTARTDLGGRATIELDLEECAAMVSKTGFADSGDHRLAPVRAAEAESVITLQRPLLVRGIVRRADGAPAPGARVSASVVGFVAGQRGRSASPQPVLTDGAGRFEMTAGAGTLRLIAERDGARTFEEHVFLRRGDDAGAEVALQFPGAQTLTGEVVDPEGRRVPGAAVRAWREFQPDPAGRTVDDERAFAHADADGRFSIDVRRLARYQLVAAAPPHAHSELVWTETTPAQPRAFVRLHLRAFVAIQGTVRRQSGPPLADVSVSASPESELAQGGGSRPGREDAFAPCLPADTDASGAFTLQAQPGATWTLTAWSKRGAVPLRLGRATGVAPGGGAIEIVVPDPLLATCTVRGRVVHAGDRTPITGFRVLVGMHDGARMGPLLRTAAVIQGNEFVLTGLPVGYRYLLQVEADTPILGGPWAPARVPFATGADGADVEVQVCAWGVLPVRLVSAAGEDLQHLTWDLSRDFLDARAIMPQSVDADGRSARERIVPGDYQLFVLRDGRRVHRQDITVRPGPNPELEVRVPAPSQGR